MKKVFYYAQIILTVLVGFCGLTLLIGGICMGAWMPIVFGSITLLFSLIVPRL